MKNYLFTITLSGYGDSIEEAWADACEGFAADSGPCDYIDHEIIDEEVEA